MGWGTQPQQYNTTVQSLRCHLRSTDGPGQVLASPTSRRHVRRPGAIVAETGRLRPIAVLRTLPALHLHVAAYAAVFLFALVAARYHCTFSWPSVCMHGQYCDIYCVHRDNLYSFRSYCGLYNLLYTITRQRSFAEYWKHFVARLNDIHVFGYNSTGSERIWMKFGEFRVYCLELAWQILGAIRGEARAGAPADFFGQVNNARLYLFPVGQISRYLHTRRGSERR